MAPYLQAEFVNFVHRPSYAPVRGVVDIRPFRLDRSSNTQVLLKVSCGDLPRVYGVVLIERPVVRWLVRTAVARATRSCDRWTALCGLPSLCHPLCFVHAAVVCSDPHPACGCPVPEMCSCISDLPLKSRFSVSVLHVECLLDTTDTRVCTVVAASRGDVAMSMVRRDRWCRCRRREASAAGHRVSAVGTLLSRACDRVGVAEVFVSVSPHQSCRCSALADQLRTPSNGTLLGLPLGGFKAINGSIILDQVAIGLPFGATAEVDVRCDRTIAPDTLDLLSFPVRMKSLFVNVTAEPPRYVIVVSLSGTLDVALTVWLLTRRCPSLPPSPPPPPPPPSLAPATPSPSLPPSLSPLLSFPLLCLSSPLSLLSYPILSYPLISSPRLLVSALLSSPLLTVSSLFSLPLLSPLLCRETVSARVFNESVKVAIIDGATGLVDDANDVSACELVGLSRNSSAPLVVIGGRALSTGGLAELSGISVFGRISETYDVWVRCHIGGRDLSLSPPTPLFVQLCGRGLAPDVVSKSVCQQCVAGRYSVDGTTCEACAPGRYSQAVGATECFPCPVDRFNDKSGANSYSLCKVCNARVVTFSRICLKCCPSRVRMCRACVSAQSCSVEYNQLGVYVTLANGSSTPDACVCKEGYVLDVVAKQQDRKGTICKQCSSQMSCSEPNRNSSNLVIKKGYWRAHNTSLRLYKCRLRRACVGGMLTMGVNASLARHDRDLCREHHRGALCEVGCRV